MPADTFTIAIVPGTNPGKWTRIWTERRPRTPLSVVPIEVADQRAVLDDGRADLVFARLPLDVEGLAVIPLYEDATVVVAARDDAIAAFESVTMHDLQDEPVVEKPFSDAIDLVVAGAGIIIVPQSVARQFSRKDLAVRPISDAAPTRVALAWRSDATTADIEEFVGIVRGRTVASSRGTTAPAPAGRRRR
jgi:DNA-binding transcriptional LysR family regulator